MRTFVQKPKAIQQTTSAKSTTLDRSHFKPSREVNSILHFSHDFSQIPLHAKSTTNVQAKLAVGSPGDRYEQEADRVAEQVMRMPEPRVQYACDGCGSNQKDPKRWRKRFSSGLTESDHSVPVQVRPSNSLTAGVLLKGKADTPDAVTLAQISSNLRGGAQLDDDTRAYFEPKFGHSFADVRVQASPHMGMVQKAENNKKTTPPIPNDEMNSGDLIEYRMLFGCKIAKYKARQGTVVSAAMREQGWEHVNPDVRGWGSYEENIYVGQDHPEGSLRDVDKLEVGEVFYVPTIECHASNAESMAEHMASMDVTTWEEGDAFTRTMVGSTEFLFQLFWNYDRSFGHLATGDNTRGYIPDRWHQESYFLERFPNLLEEVVRFYDTSGTTPIFTVSHVHRYSVEGRNEIYMNYELRKEFPGNPEPVVVLGSMFGDKPPTVTNASIVLGQFGIVGESIEPVDNDSSEYKQYKLTIVDTLGVGPDDPSIWGALAELGYLGEKVVIQAVYLAEVDLQGGITIKPWSE